MNPTDPYTHRERGPSPAARALRGIRERSRRRRSGAVALIQVLLYAALVAVIVGGAIGGPALYRAIVGGSEHNTLKGNIDRVGQASEDYWQQFAADRDGRRKIDIMAFCNYANSQFGQGDDFVLRTLAVVDNAAAVTATEALDSDFIADGMADSLATWDTSDDNRARCATGIAQVNQAPAGYDLVISEVGTALSFATGVANWTVEATGAAAATTVTLEDIEAAGLASTRAVWVMQPAGGANFPAGAQLGTDDQNEVLIFGGVAPDGTSFCLIKVFDADDRSLVGEHRLARQIPTTATAGTAPFATCTAGTTATGVNDPRHNAGWPEAR